MRTDVLGVGFDDLTLEEAAAAGAALVEAGGFHYAVTPNPEFLLAAKHNPAFRQALLGADLVLADGVVEEIRAAAADVVFVCLGAPKQELWMVEHGPATGAHLMVGLGGSLDVFAGVVERAPEGFQKLGLEWLYRLVKEPKRIGRMAKLPLVLVQAAGARLRGK